MFFTRRFLATITTLGVLWTGTEIVRAETQADPAASYIRRLFDTSMRADVGSDSLCPNIAQFGRFAAGRAWRLLSPAERGRFDDGFCNLAVDAVGRLKATYPGLTLALAGVSPAAQDTMVISSSVVPRPGADSWVVDWQIAGVGNNPRVADLKLLGISLGIFLHSLSAGAPTASGMPGDADRILRLWRQALDRALPPQPGQPE